MHLTGPLARARSARHYWGRRPGYRGQLIYQDFFRNAVNTGMLPVVCPKVDMIAEGAKVNLHVKEGFLEADGKRHAIEPVPEFIQGIIDTGGLVEYARNLTEVPLCTRSRR